MKMGVRKALLGILSLLTTALMLFGCAGGQPGAADIQGLIQALDGKEVIVTLNDGSTVRLSVKDDSTTVKAQALLGKMVDVKVSSDGKQASSIKQVGEDATLTGVVNSIGDGTFTINGQKFAVNANTMLDGGLAPGVLARVEFVKMPDGSLIAKEIETDDKDVQFSGPIESISGDNFVIGGKTFKVAASTMLDDGLVVGDKARVEFMTKADGILEAVKIETGVEDSKFTGAIESIGANAVIIDGKTIKTNVATRFDQGLATGIKARVEFITLSDGSLLAKEIQVDRVEMENELRGREAELRNREVELEKREAELRGREAEIRGREEELRGREAEGEGARGQDNGGLRGDGSIDDNSAGGADDGGLRGDGSVDDGGVSGGGGSGGSGSSGSSG